ncbi:MAG: Rne/Rng family ribonuclease [Bacteroidetes bacterium]|nr:Rne/Rng family ribonuclease [Bacteroidota bacterium]
MNYELIINKTSEDVVIALLNDKRLVELHREKGNLKWAVGDIYFGRVGKVMTGLNAAFVDVGYEKDAFLHYLDLGPQASSLNKYVEQVRSGKQNSSNLMYFKPEADIAKDGKINELVKNGQEILIQVAKEPISAKGPRVTCEVSLAGRFIVLIPFSDKVSISSKIRSNEEKHRLKDLLTSIKPKNFGVIIRTVAEGKSVAEIESDLNDLIAKWEVCFKTLKTATPPTRVLGEVDRTNALLRDILNEKFSAIHTNDKQIHSDITSYLKNIAPDQLNILKPYEGKIPIFDSFGVERQIKSLFGKTVYLKSGAYLIVEHTEALHVIDVNSGNRAKAANTQDENALAVNLEAAAEIARQLRLRDMGGIIVVDFIDMRNPEYRKELFEKFKEFMKSDRAKHNILPPSRFGLIQLTRQRVRPEMNVDVQESCPSCQGSGKIQPSVLFVEQIETALKYVVNEQKINRLTLAVHPYIEAYITKGFFWNSLLHKWKKTTGCKITMRSMTSFGFTQFKFYNQADEEIVY